MPNLYFFGTENDNAWEDLTKWNFASDGSGSNPAHIPWTDDGNGGAWYGDYDLNYGDGADQSPIVSSAAIDPNQAVTGISNLWVIVGGGAIYNGIFSGLYMTGGSIYGGVFNYVFGIEWGAIYGGVFNIQSSYITCQINGGEFYGDNFLIQYSVSGGTFYGSGLYSESTDFSGGLFLGDNLFLGEGCLIFGGAFSGSGVTIGTSYPTDYKIEVYGGTFSGSDITINSSAVIYGGQFEINGITISSFNDSIPDPSAINITLNGTPYTGMWQGRSWTNGVYNPALYWTAAGDGSSWEDLNNWNTAADGSGDNPTNIPWTDDGDSGFWYSNYDLIDAFGGTEVCVALDLSGDASCDIQIKNSDYISIFSGNFLNVVTSSGDVGVPITFEGGSFAKVYDTGQLIFGVQIYGGLFYGDMYCAGYVFSGDFTGSGQVFGGAHIYGGNFTGSGLVFSGNIANVPNGGIISGGVFSGGDLTVNNYPVILGGEFIFPAVSISYSGGNTRLSLDGGPTFSYPTPSGGGGGGIDIARLLGLPFFIKI